VRLFGWVRRPKVQPRQTLIVMRLMDMYRVHPQMDRMHICLECRLSVGIYPSGQEVLRQYGEQNVDILCQVCRPPSDGFTFAPGALEESGQSVPR
jgi:hypothetical protein